jgi:hypothetical protein
VLASAALVASGLTGLWVAQSSVAQTSATQPTCSASYAITTSWNIGFNWVVTVTAGGSAITGWTVTWTYANGQTISEPYNATVTQSGANVTATNASYDGSLAAGVSTPFGGEGTWSGTNSVPTLTCTATYTPTATTGSGTTTTVGPTPTTIFSAGPYTGNATYFDALGSPYGGCGLPQSDLDSQNFLALNVQNTPDNYSTALPRPIPAADESEIGMFDNGMNCGRWVHVVIGDYCTGTNDGEPNEPFCRNGDWVSDQYNGASLDMIVADSCQDGNAWCRDDPYHVDLAHASLNQFTLNGTAVGSLTSKWNNRQVTWNFEPAPSYTGDIDIGILQGSKPQWTAIGISHLANGIHGVDYLLNGVWTKAAMDADMGDDYLVLPTTANGTSYEIRVYDVTDQLINDGREYLFSYPSSCGTQCSPAYTPLTYTTSQPSSGTTSSSTATSATTATTTTTAAPTTTTTTTAATTTTTAAPTTTTAATTTTTAAPTTTTTVGNVACSASYAITSQWANTGTSGGFNATVTVTAGSSPLTSWKVTWVFANGQTVTSPYNANITQSGPSVTATNASYNGSLAAGASTTFGIQGSWSGTNPVPTLTCT